MLNVLYLLDSLNRGGAEMLALDVCRNARANNINLTFVATGGGALAADFESSADDFIRLNRRLPLDPLVIWQLRRAIKQRKIQIVHAHQAVEGLHAYFAARGTNAKVVLSFHGFIPDEKNRRALKFLIPRTAANIAVSREMLIWLAESEKFDVSRNFSIVYNGVDEQRLQSSGRDLRRELKLPGDCLLLGMLGNFYRAPRKDQLTICRALSAVFAKVENAHFVFAGAIETGAETKFAECYKFCRTHRIENRVHFLGLRQDVADILNSLDVFVLSSLHESFGIAAAEAMLCGVPVVLSDIPPLREISGDGEFAKIFETQNARMLTEKLLRLLQNPEQRRAFGDKGKQHAAENFSIAAHLQNLKKLYERVVKH